MKAHMIHTATLFAFVLLMSLALPAQMVTKQVLFHVDIPFAFMAGGAHLPAGHYLVSHPGNPYLLVIEKDDGRAQATVFVRPSTTDPNSAETKLVFHKYGDQYFLAQAWTEQDREVHECPKCRAERILAAQVREPEVKVIVAKQ
jgi:hypothetical protein